MARADLGVHQLVSLHALHKRGFGERADRLRRALWQAIEKSGFREYYDPLTGEGHGARDFTWSALLIDMD